MVVLGDRQILQICLDLCLTDFSAYHAWYISTYDVRAPDTRIEVARKHALDITKHGIKSYSQWFPSKENIVADALSCDDNRSEDELTSILYRFAPPSDADQFQDCTIAQQNCLVADLAAVETSTRQRAVQGSTHKNQARAWRQWLEYCSSIGLTNTYLDGFDKHQQIKLMGAFSLCHGYA